MNGERFGRVKRWPNSRIVLCSRTLQMRAWQLAWIFQHVDLVSLLHLIGISLARKGSFWDSGGFNGRPTSGAQPSKSNYDFTETLYFYLFPIKFIPHAHTFICNSVMYTGCPGTFAAWAFPLKFATVFGGVSKGCVTHLKGSVENNWPTSNCILLGSLRNYRSSVNSCVL